MAGLLEIIDTPSYNKEWIDTLRAAEANNIINVGPLMRYKTIQDGIDAAVAGDVVKIAPGTYELDQTIRLKTGVSLVGSGMHQTILKIADHTAAKLTEIAANGATVLYVNSVEGFVVGQYIALCPAAYVYPTDYAVASMDIQEVVSIDADALTITIPAPGIAKAGATAYAVNDLVFPAYNAIDSASMNLGLTAGGAGDGVSNVTIRDLQIDGNASHQFKPDGVTAFVGTNDEVQGGIKITRGDNVTIENCYIHHTVMAGITGGHTRGGTATNVTSSNTNDDFTTTADHGLHVGDEIEFTGTGGGVSASKTYFVYSTSTTKKFQVSETWGGSLKTLNADASNTFYLADRGTKNFQIRNCLIGWESARGAIHIDYTWNCCIDHCVIRSGFDGAYVGDADYSAIYAGGTADKPQRKTIITNNDITSVYRGIDISGALDTTISGNIISVAAAMASGGPPAGINMETTSASGALDRTIITGNIVKVTNSLSASHLSVGVRSAGVYDNHTVISNNYIAGEDYAMQLKGDNTKVIGNEIVQTYSSGNVGVNAYGPHLIFCDNTVTTSAKVGIYLRAGAVGCIVNDNIFYVTNDTAIKGTTTTATASFSGNHAITTGTAYDVPTVNSIGLNTQLSTATYSTFDGGADCKTLRTPAVGAATP